MMKNKKQNSFLCAGILILAFSAVLFLLSSKFDNRPIPTAQSNTETYAHQFSNFEATTAIETAYLVEGLDTYKTLIVQKPVEIIQQSPKVQNIKKYILNYIIQWSNQSISEAKIRIDTKAVGVQFSFSEMPLSSKISLSINDQKYAHEIPVDWAGHLALDIDDIALSTNQKICLMVDSKTMCHIVGKYIDGEELA